MVVILLEQGVGIAVTGTAGEGQVPVEERGAVEGSAHVKSLVADENHQTVLERRVALFPGIVLVGRRDDAVAVAVLNLVHTRQHFTAHGPSRST